MAVVKFIALNLVVGDELLHTRIKDSRGQPVRCRVNGRCKTWATRPTDFRLPVKYGLKECFYITPANADEWTAVRFPDHNGE